MADTVSKLQEVKKAVNSSEGVGKFVLVSGKSSGSH